MVVVRVLGVYYGLGRLARGLPDRIPLHRHWHQCFFSLLLAAFVSFHLLFFFFFTFFSSNLVFSPPSLSLSSQWSASPISKTALWRLTGLGFLLA